MKERRPATAGGRPERRRAATADSATLDDQCHPRKIFIGGLAHKTTTQQLRDYFARYGAIVDAVVLRWPDGRSRGFGYVTFSEANAASQALRIQHQVGGRQVDVKRAVPGTNKLFVGGLPQNTTAAELREHFETFGVVSDAVVMIDPATSRSRGFGFVCFLPGQEGAAAVTSSLEQYQNHRLRGKWIEVKSAAPPHKLAKDGEASSSEAGSGSIPDCTQGPQVDSRPVASPQHRRQQSNSSSRSVPPESQKAATMTAAFAAMGAPPGLDMSDDSEEKALMGRWPQASAQPPWPVPGCLSLSSALGALPTFKAPGCAPPVHCSGIFSAGLPPPGFNFGATHPGAVVTPPVAYVDGGDSNYVDDLWGDDSSSFGSGLSGTNDLTKSLEQLLRQQAQKRVEIETEAEERGKDTAPDSSSASAKTVQVDEVMASPSTTDEHGGLRKEM
jgi:RNA recognition motif-containing protein